jgi:hypothetical protein
MASITVTSTAQQVPDNWILIQNFGPSRVFIDDDSGVTSANGCWLEVGGSWDIGGRAWVVTASGTTSDLRVFARS